MDRRLGRALLLLLLVAFLLSLGGRTSSKHNGDYPFPTSRPAVLTDGAAHGKPVVLRGLAPANSTLGFGAIAVLSHADSVRLPSLMIAANITDINITIPTQPQWTDQDLDNFYAKDGSWISRGSALAWLGHLNILRWFLSTDLESVLIFEDDVDWDIHLRTEQIPTVAAAVRLLTSHSASPSVPHEYVPRLGNYWGNLSSWDLLYLGHCGDVFRPDAWTDSVARVVFPDDTLLPFAQLHPYTTHFLQSISVPSGSRVVHKSIFPLCTFGFALTRHAAYRLLNEIAAREPDGGITAYDVRVLEACRDFGLRCFSVSPELFRHVESESEIEHIDFSEDGQPLAGIGVDKSGRLKPIAENLTPNIACPIRSKYFFSQDPDTLDFLRDEVGRKGHCLTDTMEEDMSRVADEDPDTYELPEDFVDPRFGG